jgi:hypothetical protein
VAPIINGDTPYVTPLSAPKATDCDAGLTVKLCATGVAAPWLASPAWLAVIEHPPPATIVTVLPVTVQTCVVLETKLTASPELAVAAMLNGDTPYVTSLNAPNATVCDAELTVKLCATGVAAA